MNITDVLFNPQGRIGPQNYWIGVLIILAGNLFLTWIPVLGIVIWLGLYYVGFCVYGKRLHDIGKSMWIHALFLVVSFVIFMIAVFMAGGSIFAMAMNSSGNVSPAAMASMFGSLFSAFALPTLLAIAYTIWLGVAKGDVGDNRFGAPESAPVPAAPQSAPPPSNPTVTPPSDSNPPPPSA